MTNNLKELAQQVTPGDVVSTHGVRKAMGISVPCAVAGDGLVDLTEGACPPGRPRSPWRGRLPAPVRFCPQN